MLPRVVPIRVVAEIEDLLLVAGAPHEFDHPAIEVLHLDAQQLFLRAEVGEVRLDVGREVRGERCEEDPSVRIAMLAEQVGEPPRPVHRRDRLAGAAPPRTSTGPFHVRSTSLRCEGCRKMRQNSVCARALVNG
jgi:hypothetical protein